jgi:hypothetical protein
VQDYFSYGTSDVDIMHFMRQPPHWTQKTLDSFVFDILFTKLGKMILSLYEVSNRVEQIARQQFVLAQ